MKGGWSEATRARLREARLTAPTAETLRPAVQQAASRVAARTAAQGGSGRLEVDAVGSRLTVDASGPRRRQMLGEMRRELAARRPQLHALYREAAARALWGER